MAKGKGNTVAAVEALIAPVVQAHGVYIWDIRFEKEGPDWFLRIFIDKPEGIDINDCEQVSRAVDPLLDEADLIVQSYVLEVSSPGLGRRLTRPPHFERFMGEGVRARFIRPENGLKELRGALRGFSEGSITIEGEHGTLVSFEIEKTSYVKLCDDEDLF